MKILVLLRHGESQWNKENRFTGWTDVELSDHGRLQAHEAGRLLREAGYGFDIAFTSLLKRAIDTLNIALDETGYHWIPVVKTWRLNERHYGALQGLNKSETVARYGEAQVKLWRRSFDVRPQELSIDDPRYPGHDIRYKSLDKKDIPVTESLKDVVERLLPFWRSDIAPELLSGKHVMISAHGNSLRALVKHLDGLSEDEIREVNIPTGIPLIYELDDTLKPQEHSYLGDREKIHEAINRVAAQGKAKK